MLRVTERIGHMFGLDIFLSKNNPCIGYAPQYLRGWKGNKQLLKMFRHRMMIIPTHYRMEKLINGYEELDFDAYGVTNNIPPNISFTNEEEDRGRKLLKEMGIPFGSKIICFHARDNSYLKNTYPKHDYSYHDYRDCDIYTYYKGLDNLNGYVLIRMGNSGVKPMPRCIDYANSKFRSDFADIYLISRCCLFIGNQCGIDGVAFMFRKENCIVNMIPMGTVYAWSPKSLFIFKKLWLIKEKRLLKFREIIQSNIGMFLMYSDYKNNGIEIIDNTPDEISDVIDEKEQRLRGAWQTNQYYESMQRDFWSLYSPNKYNMIYNARVGSKFLMQNRDLI